MAPRLARGTDRVEAVEWLDEEPFPRARARVPPPLVLETDGVVALAAAEGTVRDVLARLGDFLARPWPPQVELSDDPGARLWQPAGIAPIGALHHQALLGSTTAAALITRLGEQTLAARDTVVAGRAGALGDDGPDRSRPPAR